MILDTWLTKWYVTFDIWKTPLHINTVFVKYNTACNKKNIVIGVLNLLKLPVPTNTLYCTLSVVFISESSTDCINAKWEFQHPTSLRKPQGWIIKLVSAEQKWLKYSFSMLNLSSLNCHGANVNYFTLSQKKVPKQFYLF